MQQVQKWTSSSVLLSLFLTIPFLKLNSRLSRFSGSRLMSVVLCLWINTGVMLANVELYKSIQALKPPCRILCAIIKYFLCAVPHFARSTRKKITCHICFLLSVKTYLYELLCIHKKWNYVATCCCFTRSLACLSFVGSFFFFCCCWGILHILHIFALVPTNWPMRWCMTQLLAVWGALLV